MKKIIFALILFGMNSANAEMFSTTLEKSLTKFIATDDGEQYIKSDDSFDIVFNRNITTLYREKPVELALLTLDAHVKIKKNEDSMNYNYAFKFMFKDECESIFQNLTDTRMFSAIKNFHDNELNANFFREIFHRPSTESIILRFPTYDLEYYVSTMPLAVDNDVTMTCGVIKRNH